ncbi:MAG: hypothetical protein AAFY88_17395, partial [Acidobacteriota bacterium]
MSSAPAWMPPAWRRLVLIGYGPADRRRLAPLLAGAAEDAVLDHARTDEIRTDPDGGTLLILAPEVDGLAAPDWLRRLRQSGRRMPALLFAAEGTDDGDLPDTTCAELSPFDVLVAPDSPALRRSLGYLRQSVADQRLADDILSRLQAFEAAGSGTADVARVMEIARGLRAQLDEKEAEVEHLAARCESLQARHDAHALRRRVRELEAELQQSEELRKGHEIAMVELRRRHHQAGAEESPGGQTDLMARLMFSEWMRTSQQQQLQYLQERLDDRDHHFQALAALVEAPHGESADPGQLLEAVATRLTAYERARGERRGVARLSHAVESEAFGEPLDEALDEAQSRRNAEQRLEDAMAFARRFDATLACLLISIDDPDELRSALKEANALSKAIWKRRHEAGMIHLDLPDVELLYDEEG